jgi:hypothetical protein
MTLGVSSFEDQGSHMHTDGVPIQARSLIAMGYQTIGIDTFSMISVDV